MSRIFRQGYTKPIPADAKIVTVKGKKFARFTEGGKTTVAPLTEGEDRIRLYNSKWYGEYKNADGVKVRVPLSEDETASRMQLNRLVEKVELQRLAKLSGIEASVNVAEQLDDMKRDLAKLTIDPFERHTKRPLAEHIDDFERYLASKNKTEKQRQLKIGRIRRLLLHWCGWKSLQDLDIATVQRVLPENVPGEQTRAYYVREAKSIGRWLAKGRRIGFDPFTMLEPPEVKEKLRDRRPFLEPELRLLLGTAKASTKVYRGLTGTDRHFLYLTAAYTGYRVEELSILTPEHFQLNGEVPAIFLPAKDTKNGKAALQPVPPAIAAEMAEYLATKTSGEKVWPGTWWLRAATMLRIDLAAAKIKDTVTGPEGTLHLDFHSLRHSLVHLLKQAGVGLTKAMRIARHSDPKLTANRYGREDLAELGAAVSRCPNLLAKPAKTEPSVLPEWDYGPASAIWEGGWAGAELADSSLPIAYPSIPQSSPHYLTLKKEGWTDEEIQFFAQDMWDLGFAIEDAITLAPTSISGGWDRTTDTRLMKPLL